MNEEVEVKTGTRTFVITKKIKHGPSTTKRILEETIANQMKKRSTGSENSRKGSEWVIQYGVTNASVKDILEDEYSIDHKRWLTETYPKESSKVFSHEIDFSDTSEETPTEAAPSKVQTPPKEEPPPEKKKVVEITEPVKEDSSLEELSEEEPPVEQQPPEEPPEPEPPEPKPPEEKCSTDCTEYCKKFLQERDPAWMANEINRPLGRRNKKPHVCESSHIRYNNTSNSYILNAHKVHDVLSSNGWRSLDENSPLCSSFSHVKPDPPWDKRMSWKSPHSDNFADKHIRPNGRRPEAYANCSCDQNDAPGPRESSLYMRQKKSLYIIRSSPRCYKVMEEKTRMDRDPFWKPITYKSQAEVKESPQSSYRSEEEHVESQQPPSRSEEEDRVRGLRPAYRSQEEPVENSQPAYRSHERRVSSHPPSNCTDRQDYIHMYALTPKSVEGRSLCWCKSQFDPASAQPHNEPEHCGAVCSCSCRFNGSHT